MNRNRSIVLGERIDENRMGAVHAKTPVNGVLHHHGAVPLAQLRDIGNPDVDRTGAGGDLTPIVSRVCRRVEVALRSVIHTSCQDASTSRGQCQGWSVPRFGRTCGAFDITSSSRTSSLEARRNVRSLTIETFHHSLTRSRSNALLVAVPDTMARQPIGDLIRRSSSTTRCLFHSERKWIDIMCIIGVRHGNAAPSVRDFPEATVSAVDSVPAVFRRWCEGRRVLGCALCPRSLRNFRLVNG